MSLTYAEIVEQARVSQARFERLIATVTDEQARQPSGLPGWTRGHVITHVARSADGVNRLASGVLSGVEVDMYPGGPDARAAAIEEGADRPADLLRADTRFSGHRALDALAAVAPEQYDTPVRWRKPITAAELPVLRWRELEIHLVDLDLGYSTADWPDEFVAFNLVRELKALPDRAPGVSAPVLRDHELLAWLVGRLSGEGLPELPAWP
jgi:maleylpyruvate isomerase